MRSTRETMIEEVHDEQTLAAEHSVQTWTRETEKVGDVAAPLVLLPWYQRLWHSVRRSPLPLAALLLLLVSLLLWLTHHDEVATWTLFFLVLLGGLPLL
ncbi:MAG TPA: hypothetical protein VFQ30_02440 [Ktedonobacteraceae bacterium]|nr:hypothetical protein [Ktedonobacteraceae bacterium]